MVVVGLLVIPTDVRHERNCCERISWASMESSKSRKYDLYVLIYGCIMRLVFINVFGVIAIEWHHIRKNYYHIWRVLCGSLLVLDFNRGLVGIHSCLELVFCFVSGYPWP